MKSDLFRVTTFALAFTAFTSTASAQQPIDEGLVLYFNDTSCSGISIQLDATGLSASNNNACRGTCEDVQGITFKSVLVSDPVQNATTCYLWQTNGCNGNFDIVARSSSCTETNFTGQAMSVQCFRGIC